MAILLHCIDIIIPASVKYLERTCARILCIHAHGRTIEFLLVLRFFSLFNDFFCAWRGGGGGG